MEAIAATKEALLLAPQSQITTDVQEDLLLAPGQMARAIQIAARKVKLLPKAESGFEMYTRINSDKVKKKNKAVKRAAKKMVKKKEIKKMTTYFKTK
jgi:predicted Zn-dependent protease